MRPEAVVRCFEMFERRLAEASATKGLRLENKAETNPSLFIYDVIGRGMFGDGITAADVTAALAQCRGCKTLDIYINSPGGSVFEAKAIYSQIARFSAHKVVTIDSIAGSAATFIAMAGDEIVTSLGAEWFVHRVMGQAAGFSDSMREMAEIVDRETESLIDIYAQRTKLSREALAALLLGDKGEGTLMSASEAKTNGFTDRVLGEEKPARSAAAAIALPPLVAAVTATRDAIADVRRARLLDRLQQDRPAASRETGRASPGKGTP